MSEIEMKILEELAEIKQRLNFLPKAKPVKKERKRVAENKYMKYVKTSNSGKN